MSIIMIVIHKFIILFLSFSIVILNNLNNRIKLKLFLMLSNIISKIICLNIIFFSLLENKLIGILLMILYFMILSIDRTEIREEFVSNFRNNK